MPEFSLTLHKTYYNSCFFNITIDYDRFIGEHNSTIKLNITNPNYIIKGWINRKAQPNGTPIIMGGTKLRYWFQSNFEIDDTIIVKIENKYLLIL